MALVMQYISGLLKKMRKFGLSILMLRRLPHWRIQFANKVVRQNGSLLI
ncbi:hypothetical protein O3W44_21065 [Pantoea sp. LMR881]|nr:hypothetical protein [Pantoea sp. LMR881]MCZ4061043.1 hypothetical protein [Pantoea sp. LMR881]